MSRISVVCNRRFALGYGRLSDMNQSNNKNRAEKKSQAEEKFAKKVLLSLGAFLSYVMFNFGVVYKVAQDK